MRKDETQKQLTPTQEAFGMAVFWGNLRDIANGQLTGQDCQRIVAWFEAHIEAAVAAERERIIAELETQIQIASYGGSSYRETARMVLEKAIEIVKGGEDATNK